MEPLGLWAGKGGLLTLGSHPSDPNVLHKQKMRSGFNARGCVHDRHSLSTAFRLGIGFWPEALPRNCSMK